MRFPRRRVCIAGLGYILSLLAVLASVVPVLAQGSLDQDYLRSFMRDWTQSHQTGLPVTGADLNGDGKVNWADSQMAVGRALTGAPVISPDAVVLPTDGTVTTSVVDDTHVALTGSVPDLTPGKIIVSASGDGLLRKVVSVTAQDGGGVLVETAPAALCEAVESGSFDAALPADPNAQMVWEPGVQPTSVRSEGISSGIKLNGISLSGSSTSGSSVKLVSGSISFLPTVNVGGDIKDFRLKEFHASVGGTPSMSAGVRFENTGGNIALQAEKKLGSLALGKYTAQIGAVPVVLCPKLDFSLGFEVGSRAPFNVVEEDYSSVLSAELGARWCEGEWSPIASKSADNTVAVKYLSLTDTETWAKVYLKMKLSVYLYGVFGPGIDLQNYLKGVLDVDSTARTYSLVGYHGVQSSFSINANILDLASLSWSQTILGPYEEEIARISGSWPDVDGMVWVPPGEFMMGTLDDEGYDDEHPQHLVRITQGFWLGRCEVTNAQYAAFLNAHGSNQDGSGNRLIYDNSYGSWCKVAYVDGTWVALAGWENHPVIDVTWYGAKAYCDHYGLRLPTEAEWEYAARGPSSLRYPWGNDWDASKCCNWDNRGPAYDASTGPGTMPVGSLPAGNSWCGASDLAGNVCEWCNDWYDDSYYSVSPMDDPQGPLSGSYRLLRGGSWDSYGFVCRSAYRYCLVPGDSGHHSGDFGFRVARTP
jgi:formylglycine-generating enzyme required for sulfatase activity